MKTVYISDRELKNRIQEERCIKIKANKQAETNFTPIINYQENMPPNPTHKQRDKSKGEKKLSKHKTTLISSHLPDVTERNSYGLGYHNRQLDSKNQSFPICNKMSNTKGSNLVPYSGRLK